MKQEKPHIHNKTPTVKHTHTHTHTHTYAHTHTYTHTHIRAHTHIHTHARARAHTHTTSQHMHTSDVKVLDKRTVKNPEKRLRTAVTKNTVETVYPSSAGQHLGSL